MQHAGIYELDLLPYTINLFFIHVHHSIWEMKRNYAGEDDIYTSAKFAV